MPFLCLVSLYNIIIFHSYIARSFFILFSPTLLCSGLSTFPKIIFPKYQYKELMSQSFQNCFIKKPCFYKLTLM